MTARAHHPFLDPVDASWAQKVSDVDPPLQGVIALGSGDLVHVPPPGSIPHQLLSRGRTEGTEATRAVQAAHEAKRRPHKDDVLTNGATPRQDRLEAYDQDLYGSGS